MINNRRRQHKGILILPGIRTAPALLKLQGCIRNAASLLKLQSCIRTSPSLLKLQRLVSILSCIRTSPSLLKLQRLVWALPLLLVACSAADYYNEYRPTGLKGWHRDSVLTLSVEVTDTLSVCDMYLQLRHAGRYPYRNLWLEASLSDSNRLVIYSDTVELLLADADGNWLGAGSGQILHFDQPYRRGIVFGSPGIYQFKLRHCMDDILLKDVSHAGLRIAYQNGKK